MRYITSILLLPLFLFGCDTPNTPAEQAVPPTQDVFRYGAPSNALIDEIVSGDDTAAEFMAADMEVEHMIRTASSAADADKAAKGFISTISDAKTRTVLEETAAHRMLAHWAERATPSERGAIESAVITLLERESPEATLVWAGLQRVDGHWSGERIRAAAQQTLAAVDATGLERCITCASNGGAFLISDEEAETTFGLDAEKMQREAEAFSDDLDRQTVRRDAAVRSLEEIVG